jgi:hypothetical protein
VTIRTKPIIIEIFSKPDCHLCDEVKLEIAKMESLFALDIREINIMEHADLYEKYKLEIPVIHINGRKAFKYRVEEQQLLKRLASELQ